MRDRLRLYLEKNIPFALFRTPNQSMRLVAQMKPLSETHQNEEKGFHFAPFSQKEIVPHFVIQNEVDILIKQEKDIPMPTIKQLEVPSFLEKNSRMSVVDFPTYQSHIQQYLDFFEKENLQKAIYSRIKKTDLPQDFNLFSFFEKIENAYPRAMVYVVNLPGLGLWIGASPEKLLTYQDGVAETVALAGTQKIPDNTNVEQLTWGAKEIEEHQMVVDYIFEKIKNNHFEILNRSETYTSQAGSMAHLKQRFEVKITKSKLSQFIQDLHPTPAVCGLPKEQALDLIRKTEPYDREYYAGYLGMVEKDAVNFYVNLRCMKIIQNTALLFVGGGITANSEAKKEWDETELKAKTLLNILNLIEV